VAAPRTDRGVRDERNEQVAGVTSLDETKLRPPRLGRNAETALRLLIQFRHGATWHELRAAWATAAGGRSTLQQGNI
jgi:hypothetical protein